jgi:AcrR family transcriptional regulator
MFVSSSSARYGRIVTDDERRTQLVTRPFRRRATEAAEPQVPAVSDDPCFFVGRRRRGPELERAIYDATLAELGQHGLESLTMEGVASAAHTGKAVLYRRWSTKEDLVLDAVGCTMPSADDVGASTGSLRDDLLRFLGQMAEFVSSPHGRITRSLLSTAEPDHPLLEMTRTQVIEPRLEHARLLIAAAVERGEARPGTATTGLAQVGPAMILQRFMLWGHVDQADVESIVDDVLLPLLST